MEQGQGHGTHFASPIEPRSFHKFTGHQPSAKHYAILHSEYNVALTLKESRVEEAAVLVSSRMKYGLTLRYQPESRVRVDLYGSM